MKHEFKACSWKTGAPLVAPLTWRQRLLALFFTAAVAAFLWSFV